MSAHPAPQNLTLDQLVNLREKTERLSGFLASRLRTHLATLYPILAPKRVFGTYIGSKETVARAEEAYNQLAERFKEAAGAPFEVRQDLDEAALAAMEYGVEIYPWEYTHTAGPKTITITSPVRWVVSYKSDYTLSQMRALAAGGGEKKAAPVRQFIANALAMQIVTARTGGLVQMLEDLRYRVETLPGPGLGKLPLLTISFPIASFRPPDELIVAATRFSGVPAFIELVDTSGAALQDALGEKVASLLSA